MLAARCWRQNASENGLARSHCGRAPGLIAAITAGRFGAQRAGCEQNPRPPQSEGSRANQRAGGEKFMVAAIILTGVSKSRKKLPAKIFQVRPSEILLVNNRCGFGVAQRELIRTDQRVAL